MPNSEELGYAKRNGFVLFARVVLLMLNFGQFGYDGASLHDRGSRCAYPPYCGQLSRNDPVWELPPRARPRLPSADIFPALCASQGGRNDTVRRRVTTELRRVLRP